MTPRTPSNGCCSNVLAMVAELESDLIRARTREGLAVARAASKLRGRKPELTPAREALLIDLHKTGQKRPSDRAELSGSADLRSTARSRAPPETRRLLAPQEQPRPNSAVRSAPHTAEGHTIDSPISQARCGCIAALSDTPSRVRWPGWVSPSEQRVSAPESLLPPPRSLGRCGQRPHPRPLRCHRPDRQHAPRGAHIRDHIGGQ